MPLFGTRFLVLLCGLFLSTSSAFAQTEGTAQQNLPAGPYQITPGSNPSACVEVRGGNNANGNPVDVSTCLKVQTSQVWKLIPVQTSAGAGYQIISAMSASCIDVAEGARNDGGAMNQWTCIGTGQLNQVWQLFPFGSSYELVSLNSGKCLDLPDGNSANGAQLKQYTCGQGKNPNQIWNLRQGGTEGVAQDNMAVGPYQLTPALNGSACADVSRGLLTNGTPITLYQCSSAKSPNQLWKLLPVQGKGGSGYQVVSVNSGSCMDVAGVSRVDGAVTNQWECLGGNQTNQVWQLFPFGSSYELVSLNSGKCLDVPNGNTSNLVQLQQYACGQGTNPNQLWNLRPVAGEGTPQAGLAVGTYQLNPTLNSSACADVSGGNIANGVPVITFTCNGTSSVNQIWKLVSVPGTGGLGYQIVSLMSGSCLEVSGAARTDGALAQQWECLGATQLHQVWQAYPFGSSYELVSLNSGKCLDVPNGVVGNGVQLQQHTCSQGNNPAQLWSLKQLSSEGQPQTVAPGPYQLSPAANAASCADVSGGGSANGTPVIVFSCNGTKSPNQIWRLVSVGGSSYQIVSTNSGACLDVSGVSRLDNAVTDQWACYGASQLNQVWQLYAFGSSYELVSVNSGKCLDLPNGNSSNGVQLQQYTCGQGKNPNQLWSLNLVAAAPAQVAAPAAAPAATTSNLQVTPTSAVTGQMISLTARVASAAGVPASTVSFFDGGTLMATTTLDTSGVASYTTSSLANGSHMLTAQYGTSDRYAASVSPQVQVTVTQSSKGEQAFAADSFADSVGVATHLAYDDTAYYQQWPVVLNKLQSLGVRHIRDGFYNWPSNSPYIAEHRTLANLGIKTTYVVPIDGTTTPQIVKNFASLVGDVEALEGPNECDAVPNCGGGEQTGIKNAAEFMPVVYASGKALNVPVIGPSFIRAESYVAAGNLSSLMTHNNLHVYFGGRNPGSMGWGGSDANGNAYGSFDWWIDQGQQSGPGLPTVITETGYLAFPGMVQPYTIPESVEAIYMPRLLSLAFNRGIKRTFMYELLDENASTGYGLLRVDLSEKPAFTAVKNLLSLVSDAGTTFTPGKLDYTINGGGSTLAHTLLQKRDGSFYLLMWLEQSSYDMVVNKAIPVVPQNVVVSFNGAAVAKQVIRFDNAGNAITTTVDGSGTVLPLTLSDAISVIRITPQ